MNIKEEKERDYLKLNKLLQGLRLLRYNYANTENGDRIDSAINELEPLLEELKVWLESAVKPIVDYDL